MRYFHLLMALCCLGLTFFIPSITGKHGWILAALVASRMVISFTGGVFFALFTLACLKRK